MKASKAEASFVYFPLSKPHNWGKDSLLSRRRFIQRLRAIPHNLARRLTQDFCPNSKFRKWRNTLCISHFWNCGSGTKRRLRLADTIARCCLSIRQKKSLKQEIPRFRLLFLRFTAHARRPARRSGRRSRLPDRSDGSWGCSPSALPGYRPPSRGSSDTRP